MAVHINKKMYIKKKFNSAIVIFFDKNKKKYDNKYLIKILLDVLRI